MKKLTKKRLKEIKEHLDFIQFEYDRQGYISTNTADELIEYCKYFIERVEQLQQENERLKKFLSWEQEEAQGLDEEVTFQLERLKQAQAKAERYKNHLLYIQKHYGLPSEPTDFVPVTVLHEIQMIVSNALEGES